MKTVVISGGLCANRGDWVKALQSAGWFVLEVADTDEALQGARKEQASVLVADCCLGEGKCCDLIHELRSDEQLCRLPLILCLRLVPLRDPARLAREMDVDVDGVIPRSLPADALLQEINRVTQAARQVSLPSDRAGSSPAGTQRNELLAAVFAAERMICQRERELICLSTLGNLEMQPDDREVGYCCHFLRAIVNNLSLPSNTVLSIQTDNSTFACSIDGVIPCDCAKIDLEVLRADETRLSLICSEEPGFRDPLALDSVFSRSLSHVFVSGSNRFREQVRERRRRELGEQLLQLGSAAEGTSQETVFREYLEASVDVTDSGIGYLHLVSENQEVVEFYAWSRETGKLFSAESEEQHPIAQAEIWADCVRMRRPVLHNDDHVMGGQPEVHVPLCRYISVPVIEDGRVTLIVGVGNRIQPYTEQESELVQAIASELWKVVARRRGALALEQVNRRLFLLEAAVKAATHSVVITNAGGIIEWVNPAFTEATGYTAAEAIGQHTRILKSGAHDEADYKDLWETISAGRVWRGHLKNRRKDGSLFEEEVIITPVKEDEKIKHFIAVKQDLTEKVELEKRLLRSQRMEAIGLLAGGVAHDLNNVLSPIMMSVDMFKYGLSPSETEELVATLTESCQRGADIVRQLLTFARGADGERVMVQVRHLVKDVAKIARETFSPKIEVLVDVSSKLWPVIGDATQIHQVLLNLAINARDAMKGRGRLTFSGANVELKEPREFMGLELQSGRSVCISIIDTGPGIPEDMIERIFEPFFTTKDRGKGTGLGLPTALGIVRSHHGMINMETRTGQGTTFSVYLPAVEHVAADVEMMGEKQVLKGHGETLLVVDDEHAIRKIMRSILESNGYRVLTAEDGAEGVAIYAEQKKAIDLVITDIMMPVMDGAAMVSALRKLNADVRVMGVSGYVGRPDVEGLDTALKDLGVMTILEKPFTTDVLLEAVAEAIPQ